MVFGQEQGACVKFPVLRHVHPHRDDCLGHIKHLVDAHADLFYRYKPLQLLVNLVGDEADTDVSLNAALGEVENRPCLLTSSLFLPLDSGC